MARKPSEGGRSNFVLVAVNLDTFQPQECYLDLPPWELGLPDWAAVEMEELFSGHRFTWTGTRPHLWIDPARPAFLRLKERRVGTEGATTVNPGWYSPH